MNIIKKKDPGRYERKGSILEGSNIGLQKWVIALYMAATSLKGVSSMKLHRELGVTQKTAWFMLSRIREAFATGDQILRGIVEVDETYIGGKEGNKHSNKKLNAGRGVTGKAAVVGAKVRKNKRVVAKPVSRTDALTLQGFVNAGYHPEGKMMPDWWEISQISSVAKEQTGYPTQKPLALLERIIKASSSDSTPPPPS